ncbi:MAG: class I SAM-dependent methyltransferase [Proteobacteria bacterium]|nr:class I SAM-dependent methyltransferase [Pseudomonadota bacterium]
MLDELFYRIFESLPRQGPGDPGSTRRALSLLPGLADDLAILDLGCGSGAQTLDLAWVTRGTILAVDNHQPFLDMLAARMAVEGLAGRVKVMNADLGQLNLPSRSFDLVWCEGAAFVLGFAESISSWKGFLKPGGCMAMSELAWLTDTPPQEARDYMDQVYPAITGMEGNLEIIRSLGGEDLGHFVLPEAAWWDAYYTPMEMRLSAFAEKYRDDGKAMELIRHLQQEIEMYRKYPDAYGYVFYVAQFA